MQDADVTDVGYSTTEKDFVAAIADRGLDETTG
jgi:hypothetical protein